MERSASLSLFPLPTRYSPFAIRHSPPSSLRRALLHQRGRGLVVGLLACQERLEADQAVVVLERDEMLLAGRERVAFLEDAQHIAHRVRSREQRDRREG